MQSLLRRDYFSVVQARLSIETENANGKPVLSLMRCDAFLRGAMTIEAGLAQSAHCLCRPILAQRAGNYSIFVSGHSCVPVKREDVKVSKKKPQKLIPPQK